MGQSATTNLTVSDGRSRRNGGTVVHRGVSLTSYIRTEGPTSTSSLLYYLSVLYIFQISLLRLPPTH